MFSLLFNILFTVTLKLIWEKKFCTASRTSLLVISYKFYFGKLGRGGVNLKSVCVHMDTVLNNQHEVGAKAGLINNVPVFSTVPSDITIIDNFPFLVKKWFYFSKTFLVSQVSGHASCDILLFYKCCCLNTLGGAVQIHAKLNKV